MHARVNYTKSTYSKDCFLTAASDTTIKWQGVNVHTFWPSANGLLRISGMIAKGCALNIGVVQSHRQGEWCIISMLHTPGLVCKPAIIADECSVWLSCDRCCSQMLSGRCCVQPCPLLGCSSTQKSCHVIQQSYCAQQDFWQIVPVCIAFASSSLHSFAMFSAKGSSGFGALSRAWMLHHQKMFEKGRTHAIIDRCCGSDK